MSSSNCFFLSIWVFRNHQKSKRFSFKSHFQTHWSYFSPPKKSWCGLPTRFIVGFYSPIASKSEKKSLISPKHQAYTSAQYYFYLPQQQQQQQRLSTLQGFLILSLIFIYKSSSQLFHFSLVRRPLTFSQIKSQNSTPQTLKSLQRFHSCFSVSLSFVLLYLLISCVFVYMGLVGFGYMMVD